MRHKPLVERRQRDAEKADDGIFLTVPDDQDEPDAPRCAHCRGQVCTLEDCEDHTEDCQLADGRWTCSRICYDAVVGYPLD